MLGCQQARRYRRSSSSTGRWRSPKYRRRCTPRSRQVSSTTPFTSQEPSVRKVALNSARHFEEQSTHADRFPEPPRRIAGPARALIERPNRPVERHNGIYRRWVNPILTSDHAPVLEIRSGSTTNHSCGTDRRECDVQFRRDLSRRKVPFGGAVEGGPQILFAVRKFHGRRSIFVLGLSSCIAANRRSGHQRLRLRLTQHEDGWIYGLFCTERKDRAQRTTRRGRRSVRHRAHTRSQVVGAACRPGDAFGPAEKRRASSRIREPEIRPLHPPSGRLHQRR